jgi:hypothetical protein
LAAKAALTAALCGVSWLGACAGNEKPESITAGSRAEPSDAMRAVVEAHIFNALDSDQQAKLIAAGAYAPPASAPLDAREGEASPLGDEGYAAVRKVVSREVFDRMMPIHQRALVHMMEMQADGQRPPSLCFAPGTDDAIVTAFNVAANGPFNSRFQVGNRWTQTATNGTIAGGSAATNKPVTLTYSFVPDGTIVPTLTSATAPSNLFARMAQIYGTDPTVWQAVYAQVFTRWSQVTGVRYVYEPHDDGVAIGAANSSGVLGVRGDCRFSGTALDGNYNVLAFNYFPGPNGGGDSVLDTNDSFFATTTTNSIRLRNTLAHEHGHGLGMNHVCPTNSTKLMEPFISTTYDGPQVDDIMLGQRYYGDTYEPNDTAATATIFTDLDASGHTIPNLSINGQADVDWFKFTLAAPGHVTITATPIGGAYLDGAQNSDGTCSAGTIYNAGTINSLVATIVAADGTTVLDASLPAAQGQAVQAEASVPAGVFYAKISAGKNNDFIQGYNLAYISSPSPGLVFRMPSGAPQRVSPTAGASVSARITAVTDAIAPNSPTLWYRTGTGAFQGVAMTAAAGGVYSANIPASPCGSTLQYYIGASGVASGPATYPAGAPSNVLTAVVNDESVIFFDDFSTDKGWSYAASDDTATAGQWIRGTPVASSSPSGLRAQTGLCYSGTQCAFTGQNVAGQAASSGDVDGGTTSLTSPPMDLSTASDPVLSYARWYFNDAGTSPQTRTFRVLISNDGVNWIPVETVGPTGPQVDGGWFATSFHVNTLLTPGAAVHVRFVADDAAGTDAATVEAAIDDFKVASYPCVGATQPPPCAVDFDGSGTLAVQDVFAFISAWFAGDPRADWDHSGSLAVPDVFAFLNAWMAGCP